MNAISNVKEALDAAIDFANEVTITLKKKEGEILIVSTMIEREIWQTTIGGNRSEAEIMTNMKAILLKLGIDATAIHSERTATG